MDKQSGTMFLSEGLTGYKLVHAVTPNGDVPAIAEVFVPEGEKVVQIGNSYRTSKVLVKDMFDLDNYKKKYYLGFTAYCFIESKYTVGKITKADKLDESLTEENRHGLHFFVDINDLKDFIDDCGYGRDM